MSFKFKFTENHLKQMIPGNPYTKEWFEAIDQILPDYDIDTPKRVAAFIAQCAHESGNFRAIKENLNYKTATLRKIFPKYFPDDMTANIYASAPNKAEKIANKVYANRMGNGPEESGDGWRYCGRGLIQLTGKNNYQAYADSLQISVEEAQQHLLLNRFRYRLSTGCLIYSLGRPPTRNLRTGLLIG
jgi:putative chitinase